MKQKGVTLIELLIVIVVMGIVAAFAVVEVGKIISNTRISVDSFNLATLNTVTEDYGEASSSAATDIFSGIATDTERMSALVGAGYLDGSIRVQQPGASFEWDIANQIWELSGGETNGYYDGNATAYDFTSDTLQAAIDAGALSYDMSDWSTDDDILVNDSGESRLYFPVALLEYTVTTNVALPTGTNGGYGVFFDTILVNGDAKKDTGYVLQFDRGYGYGEIIVRSRTSGSEEEAVVRFKSTDANSPIKNKNIDPVWWTTPHVIKIAVINSSLTERTASFYIDGELLGVYTYDNEIDGELVYSGFRGWGGGNTQFYSITTE